MSEVISKENVPPRTDTPPLKKQKLLDDEAPSADKAEVAVEKSPLKRKRVSDASDKKPESLTKDEVLKLRKTYFSKSMSVSYENTSPMQFVRGDGAYMIEA